MKIVTIFPKDSEAIFNRHSNNTFGGATVQMYLISKELYRHKDITTYSLIPKYPVIDFNDQKFFKLIKTYRTTDRTLIKIFRFHRIIQKIKPEVIIQHGLSLFSCLLAKYCKIFNIKFIFMFAHDLEVEGKYQSTSGKAYLFRLLLNNSEIIITQNEYQKTTLMNKFNTKSAIIYNGFEIKNDTHAKNNSNAKFLWVARCERWKRPEIYIQIAKSYPDNEFIMIAPPSSDSKYYSDITEMAQHVPNLKFISFVPFQEIDEYFLNSTIFINTSQYEGFPQTFIQATMNGIPIISLNANPDNIITNYNLGIYCHNKIEHLKLGIDELLNSSDVYKEKSRNSIEYALKNHNIESNVNKILYNIK